MNETLFVSFRAFCRVFATDLKFLCIDNFRKSRKLFPAYFHLGDSDFAFPRVKRGYENTVSNFVVIFVFLSIFVFFFFFFFFFSFLFFGSSLDLWFARRHFGFSAL
jgi:hypothetical protein